ncbi:3-dehydroquinate dehydratase [Lysobacter panacisoli]|uniref:3-dehydroquinate dehydratase n=1 Tax=Lysobacter panacisoli TaxID=1255263 RepID=A0ABP9L291_9GAMM|nr:3-dehydroquinate dehydratase [Lysobacter panacisoli]
MSIAIITASQAPQRHANGLPREVVSQLVERASRAGRTVAVCGCRDVADVIECVRRARGSGTEFLLLDPGTRAAANGELDEWLDRAGVPYIEVHADVAAPMARPAMAHPLSVIDGYGAQGYVLALSIALEHLGCAQCENDIHVGT